MDAKIVPEHVAARRRALLIWEPAGWEVGMAESARLAAEQRASDEFMAEFRIRNDTNLSSVPPNRFA